MEATAHSHHAEHAHHEMPTSGRALTSVALSATLHCLTGCAIGEILGMAIGTALGFSDLATIALAVTLAFLFGYALTSLPLLRAGLAFAAVVPIALASDTLSIATMEIVDNGIMLVIPGAMEAGLGSLLFWGSLAVALVIAGAVAVPVNRYLIARGKGHAVVHETGIHGGPSPRVVGVIAATAAVFGTVVLAAEAFDGDGGDGHGGGHQAAVTTKEDEMTSGHGSTGGEQPEQVRGLGVADQGLKLELARAELPRGRGSELRFRIIGSSGEPVRDFELEHDKRMHLILARRDLTGFQHLHPELDEDGTWTTDVTVPDAGSYRVFADFKHEGENYTLASDLAVDGNVDWRELPAPDTTARTDSGYEVRLDSEATRAGREAELRFTVTRDGEEIRPDDYLGAKGHLVALREGDLAYLHVHPAGHEDSGHGGGQAEQVAFMTEFPSDGRYRLFLQFKHQGKIHTAAFTQEVSR